MKTAVVSSKDLFDRKKNPTLCLSALRGTGQCHRCDKISKVITHTPLNELLLLLKCKPHISPENMAFMKEYDEHLQKRTVLENEIDLLRKRLSLKGE
jgi:hypothetical protein